MTRPTQTTIRWKMEQGHPVINIYLNGNQTPKNKIPGQQTSSRRGIACMLIPDRKKSFNATITTSPIAPISNNDDSKVSKNRCRSNKNHHLLAFQMNRVPPLREEEEARTAAELWHTHW
jgi:hypothetical protein